MLLAILTVVTQGWGVMATAEIEKGDMIMEYVGEVVRKELSELREKYYNAKVASHVVHLRCSLLTHLR